MRSWRKGGDLGGLTFISAFVWLSGRILPVSSLVYDMGQSPAVDTWLFQWGPEEVTPLWGVCLMDRLD